MGEETDSTLRRVLRAIGWAVTVPWAALWLWAILAVTVEAGAAESSLLVALADEAVEHQASLAHDDPVPVSLAEAKERLAATTQAYRDLRQPAVPQPAEQPEVSRNLQQPG